MKIAINPVSIWTPAGLVAVSEFEVRTVTYAAPTQVARATAGNAECHVLDAAGKSVSSQRITFTDEQADQWTDDAAFFRELARSAGLSPT